MSKGQTWTKLHALPLRKRLGSLSQKEEVGSWSTRRQCALFPATGLAAPSALAWLFGIAPEPPSAPDAPSSPSLGPLLPEAFLPPTPRGTGCRDFLPVLLSCPSDPTLASPCDPTTDLTAPTGQTRTRRPGRMPGCCKVTPPAGVSQVRSPGPKPEANSENKTQSPFRLGAARGPGLGCGGGSPLAPPS